MEHPINSNIDKMNKNFWNDRKPYQIICIAVAVVIAGVVIIFVAPKVGTSTSSYICALLVLPFAYIGSFNKNGLDFFEFQKAKKNNIQNGKLLAGNKMVDREVQTQKRRVRKNGR